MPSTRCSSTCLHTGSARLWHSTKQTISAQLASHPSRSSSNCKPEQVGGKPFLCKALTRGQHPNLSSGSVWLSLVIQASFLQGETCVLDPMTQLRTIRFELMRSHLHHHCLQSGHLIRQIGPTLARHPTNGANQRSQPRCSTARSLPKSCHRPASGS